MSFYKAYTYICILYSIIYVQYSVYKGTPMSCYKAYTYIYMYNCTYVYIVYIFRRVEFAL